MFFKARKNLLRYLKIICEDEIIIDISLDFKAIAILELQIRKV
jgi:hypothetical protein